MDHASTEIEETIAALTREAENLLQRETELRQELATAGLATEEAIYAAYEEMDEATRQAALLGPGAEAPQLAPASPVKRKMSRMV